MIAIDWIKQQEFDADLKETQKIKFTWNLNRGEDINYKTTVFHYWRKVRNYFKFFTRNSESITILFYFVLI